MRRYKNQYIFASDLAGKRRSHHFRNLILILLPVLVITAVVMNVTISRRVRMEELRLTLLNLPADLENFSILHLSDLHGARFGEEQKAVQSALGNNRFSCVVMTGDMVGEDGDVQPLLELIALLPQDTPKYLIPGDMDGPVVEMKAHSSLSIYASWAEELQAAGVKVLDLPELITRDKGRLWLVPENLYALDLETTRTTICNQLAELNSRATTLTPDDAARIRALEYESERIDKLAEIKKEFLPTDIQVVLTHTPLGRDYVADMIAWSSKEDPFSLRYASLILAGHYNGGQWRLPFGGAVYVPELGWFPPDDQVKGLDYLEGIPQYISPGLGSDPHYEHQPGRLYNAPVITRIVLSRRAV